jgi:hypothetical protein
MTAAWHSTETVTAAGRKRVVRLRLERQQLEGAILPCLGRIPFHAPAGRRVDGDHQIAGQRGFREAIANPNCPIAAEKIARTRANQQVGSSESCGQRPSEASEFVHKLQSLIDRFELCEAIVDCLDLLIEGGLFVFNERAVAGK